MRNIILISHIPHLQENISDLSFHPEEEMIAIGTIGGDLSIFR